MLTASPLKLQIVEILEKIQMIKANRCNTQWILQKLWNKASYRVHLSNKIKWILNRRLKWIGACTIVRPPAWKKKLNRNYLVQRSLTSCYTMICRTIRTSCLSWKLSITSVYQTLKDPVRWSVYRYVRWSLLVLLIHPSLWKTWKTHESSSSLIL